MASNKAREIELRPDGWERFKVAVKAAAKSGPKHRTKKPRPPQDSARDGRVPPKKADKQKDVNDAEHTRHRRDGLCIHCRRTLVLVG